MSFIQRPGISIQAVVSANGTLGSISQVAALRMSREVVGVKGGTQHEPSAVDNVVQTICDHIAAGRFVAGQRLPEADLVAQLGVSKTVLREAFAKLQQEGIIDLQRFKGATVKRLTIEEVIQIFDVLNALLTWAAHEAAKTIASQPIRARKLDPIRASLQQLQPRDQREHIDAFWPVVDCLLELAENPYLAAMVRRAMNPLFKEFFIDSIKFEQVVIDYTRSLDRVLEIVATGDSDKASDAFRNWSRLDRSWIRESSLSLTGRRTSTT